MKDTDSPTHKNMKRIFSIFVLCLCSLALWAGGQAKYVFYFIGDGMGVNQVNLAQTYLAALEGRIGIQPLCFTSFPNAALVTTYSATNGVTDSAAAGTALSTGSKTKNGALGMKADGKTPLQSIARQAAAHGAAVGVSTSVSVDHATPAAFYAQQAARSSYHVIGTDLVRAGFDFYAGSDFLQPTTKEGGESLYEQCQKAGYVIARGYEDFLSQQKKAKKLLLLQTEEASAKDKSALPYAIDRTDDALTLSQITQAGMDFLSQKSKKGFFLMVEGGKIDWACHSNDAATVIHEILDMDKAVSIAFDFLKKHPEETLIVVTADHETGGLVMGRGPYELHSDLLQHQRMSVEAYAAHLKELQKQHGESLSWDTVKQDLAENWGLGKEVKLSEKQEKRLENAFRSMKEGSSTDHKTLYASISALADAARATLAECALIGWQSGGHSNGYVPVFAVGVGAEKFHGQMDNTEIPLRIAEAAGWE